VHGRRVLALTAAGAVLVLLAAFAPPAAAESTDASGSEAHQPKVDVLILVGPATDWAARVRGQLSDLPVRTRSGDLPVGDGDAARASGFARQQSAEVTVWLATDGDPAAREPHGGAFVAIWLSSSQELYTRRIAADWQRLSAADRSAALEIAALSVRSAVRSLLLDAANDATGTGDDPVSNSEPEPVFTAAPSSAKDATIVPTDAEAVPEERAGSSALDVASLLPRGVELEMGGAWQLYGRGTLGVAGLRAGLRLAWADWAFEAIGQYGLPAQAQVGPATLELVRHAVLGELQYFAWEHGAWRVSPLLRAGVTSLGRRSVSSNDAALRRSTAKRYEFPTLGAGAIAELSLSSRLSMSLRGVLNVETAVPTFDVQTADGASVWSSTPWALQPSLEVGANWRF
jgi:hypothetical protein